MRTKNDIQELDLDTLDMVMGGSAPLPVGLGSNSMPQQTLPTAPSTTAIPGTSTAGASSTGYQDHFGLHFGAADAAPHTDGGMPVPAGMGGTGGGAGDGHGDGHGGGNGGGNGGGFVGATDSHSSDDSSHASGHHGQDVGVNGAQSAFDVVDQAINTIDNTIAQFAGPHGLGQTS